jgi:hypothetical protein
LLRDALWKTRGYILKTIDYFASAIEPSDRLHRL